MPRRNKRKPAANGPHRHAPSPYEKGYRAKCGGCAFAGLGSLCLTSDGKCLKLPPTAREVDDAETDRRTNKASAER
jgi:hypothetical protein